MSANHFHIHLYGPPHDSGGRNGPQTSPIPTSFEAAQERLRQSLPNVLLEADGSLAWANRGFQIVGMIYDAATMIQYVEIRGHCDRSILRSFVATLVGTVHIDHFPVMVLPDRQWKKFQSFEKTLPPGPANRASPSED